MTQKGKKIVDVLKTILEVQEFDMQMIQLVALKKERQREMQNVNTIKEDLRSECTTKEEEIANTKKEVRLTEGEIEEIAAKLKKFEEQQAAVKKVDEFNALSQEMSRAERGRVAKEQTASDLHDRLSAEEEVLKALRDSLKEADNNSKALEEEIYGAIEKINAEGRTLKAKRDKLAAKADEEVFPIYERLLGNKRNRVIVPIESRCCSGCHITLTAQHENLVRKGERLVFCEHCSRIHFWPEEGGEAVAVEGEGEVITKRRRRKSSV